MTEKKPVTKPAARRLAVLLNIESSLDRTEFTECVVMTANRRHRARRLRRRFLVDRDSGHARGASASLAGQHRRSEEHTSELQSLMRISYAVFCLKKKNRTHHTNTE